MCPDQHGKYDSGTVLFCLDYSVGYGAYNGRKSRTSEHMTNRRAKKTTQKDERHTNVPFIFGAPARLLCSTWAEEVVQLCQLYEHNRPPLLSEDRGHDSFFSLCLLTHPDNSIRVKPRPLFGLEGNARFFSHRETCGRAS